MASLDLDRRGFAAYPTRGEPAVAAGARTLLTPPTAWWTHTANALPHEPKVV
ncbi:MAG TPA: hypothetical protein VLX44_07190 [Xanthobacteraceae bacterium]|nr:hypothetical protein [Xanthobacteraceae bacterium]